MPNNVKVKINKNIGIFFLFLTIFLFIYSLVYSSPPLSPYRPGETLDPSCSPGDPNCTVSPPLPTYISTTTIVELNNNLLSFNTGTVKILGELIVTNTTTFNGISYIWPSNPPNPNQFLQYIGNGNLQWADVTLSTAGGWTDDGNVVRLQTITDSVAIGTTTPIGKFIVATGTNIGLVVDNQGFVGIGTTTPEEMLDIFGNTDADLQMTSFGEDNSTIRLRRARGLPSAPEIVQNGDTLAAFDAMGYDGSVFKRAAEIVMKVEGTPGLNIMPSAITFHTRDSTYTGNWPPERMRINSVGNVGIGTTTPSEKLTVQGNILATGGITANSLVLLTPLSITSGGTGL
ncbi:MAG: hypothetical protein QXG78_03775, partial [Candidatus Methanomethyliaceae archaeon]